MVFREISRSSGDTGGVDDWAHTMSSICASSSALFPPLLSTLWPTYQSGSAIGEAVPIREMQVRGNEERKEMATRRESRYTVISCVSSLFFSSPSLRVRPLHFESAYWLQSCPWRQGWGRTTAPTVGVASISLVHYQVKSNTYVNMNHKHTFPSFLPLFLLIKQLSLVLQYQILKWCLLHLLPFWKPDKTSFRAFIDALKATLCCFLLSRSEKIFIFHPCYFHVVTVSDTGNQSIISIGAESWINHCQVETLLISFPYPLFVFLQTVNHSLCLLTILSAYIHAGLMRLRWTKNSIIFIHTFIHFTTDMIENWQTWWSKAQFYNSKMCIDGWPENGIPHLTQDKIYKTLIWLILFTSCFDGLLCMYGCMGQFRCKTRIIPHMVVSYLPLCRRKRPKEWERE